jgi:hypothetical protein
MEQVTKPTQAQHQSLGNRSNDGGIKPPVKRQQNLFGHWVVVQPEPTTTKTSNSSKTLGTQPDLHGQKTVPQPAPKKTNTFAITGKPIPSKKKTV